MDTMVKTSARTWLLRGLAALAATVVIVIVVVFLQSGTPAPQKFHISIRGNLGATVTVDDRTTTLRAETGYDSGDFVGTEISIVSSSSGDAPNCRITNGAGVELAAQVGNAPEVVPQTISQGYGPAKYINAPTIETAMCHASAK